MGESPTERKLSLFSQGVNRRKVDLIRNKLGFGPCLDLGCGNGLYGSIVVSTCGEVCQVDMEDRRSKEARHFPFVQTDVQRLPFEPKSFDFAVAFDIMEHLDDDAMFLNEVVRVCRRRILLSVPNKDECGLSQIGCAHMHHLDKTHRREYTAGKLQECLHAAGLEVISLIPQYNLRLPKAGHVLKRNGALGDFFAKLIEAQMLGLRRIGIFEDKVVADWFCVADIKT